MQKCSNLLRFHNCLHELFNCTSVLKKLIDFQKPFLVFGEVNQLIQETYTNRLQMLAGFGDIFSQII